MTVSRSACCCRRLYGRETFLGLSEEQSSPTISSNYHVPYFEVDNYHFSTLSGASNYLSNKIDSFSPFVSVADSSYQNLLSFFKSRGFEENEIYNWYFNNEPSSLVTTSQPGAKLGTHVYSVFNGSNYNVYFNPLIDGGITTEWILQW